MGKRFLISLALVVAIIAIITAGAALLFSGRYDTLSEQQSPEVTAAAPTLSSDLSAQSAAPVPTAPPAEASSAPETSVSEPTESEAPTVSDQISTPSTEDYSTRAASILETMTLEEKICQMLFVRPEVLTGYGRVTQCGEATRDSLAQYPVGGIIYFSDNLISVEQTTDMLEQIQAYSMELTGRGLFLGVDEEGGTVARAADSLGTTAFEDMRVYGDAGDPQKAYEIGSTLAADLKALGFNIDFAPVADVLTNEENTVVKYRSFGSDPELVASMVSQEVKGLMDGGMLCAPKHFPGHGSTGGDTHDGFVSTDRTLEELERCDLLPFQAAIEAGVPMIMVGHMTMTEIDSENPASLSHAVVTDLLRTQLGYDGIVITDGLDMGAIADSYSVGETAVNAIGAGCDMLLCITDIPAAVDAVTEAVADGTLSEDSINQSVTRILSAKLQYGIIP